MHERERWQIILRTLGRQPVATVRDLAVAVGASEATLRRDIGKLAEQGLLRRVHGGAEAVAQGDPKPLATPSFDDSFAINLDRKRAIARAAAQLCQDGESIIINGGTTTFEMAEPLRDRRMLVLTNSFPMADVLLRHSRNRVLLPGGEVYRKQNMVLSPYDETSLSHHYASTMFTGCQGVVPVGVLEGDPLLARAEQNLMARADRLVVLMDSTKFRNRGGLVLCALDRIWALVTDEDAPPEGLRMLEAAGVRTIVAPVPRFGVKVA